MARDLDINIRSRSDSAALDAAARNVDHLRREADRLGDEFKRASREAAAFDRQLLETKAATAALAREFAKTGDVEVKKQLIAQRSALQEVRKLRSDIIGDTEKDAKAATRAWERSVADMKKLTRQGAEEGAQTFAQVFQGGIINALKNPAVAGAAAAAGGALAIGAGATIGGTVLGAAGGGAVAGGIAGAFANDPKAVGGAWSAETAKIKANLLDATTSWVGPSVAAAHEFGSSVAGVRFDKIFGAAAGYIQPLVAGGSALVRSLGAAAEILVEHAGPEIQVIAKELPQIGDAFKQAATDIAGGSEGGAKALGDMLNVLEGVIIGTGRFIGYAEGAYDSLTKASNATRDFVQAAAAYDPVLGLASGFGTLSEKISGVNSQGATFAYQFRESAAAADQFGQAGTSSFYGLDQRARDLASSMERLNKDFDDAANKTLALSNANLAAAQDVFDLKEAFKQNGATIDANNQKGIANLQVINQTIDDYLRQRDAAIAAGGGTQAAYDQANKAFHAQLQALEDLLVKLGIARDKAHNLLAAFDELAKPITKIVTVKVVGQVSGQGVISSGDLRRAVGSAYATGGKVKQTGWALVGEQGPEIRWMNAGDYVFNAEQTSRLASAGTTGVSVPSGSPSVGMAMPPMTVLEQAFAAVVLKLQRTGALPS